MFSRLVAALRRLRFGHYFLIFVLALVMLLVSLVLKGYIAIPARLAQRIPLLSSSRPTVVAQAQLPEAIPTDQAATMSGMDQSGMAMADATSEVTATPTIPKPIATSTGIVTVITLTPTGAVTAAVPVPSSTEQVMPEEQATAAATIPTLSAGQTPTPTLPPTDAAQPIGTLMPATAVPALTLEPSAALLHIRTDMQNLDRILHATRVLVKTFGQEQPTVEELAAIRAQLTVVAQRMSRLAAQLQTFQSGIVAPPGATDTPPTATATPAINARISPEQVRDLMIQMQGMLELLQGVLADPATDSTTLAQAQTMLSQLQEMMKQLQTLTASMQTANQPGSILVTATPTIMPRPTATILPTATAMPTATTATMTNGQVQEMMSQMEQLLDQMQSILNSRQN